MSPDSAPRTERPWFVGPVFSLNGPRLIALEDPHLLGHPQAGPFMEQELSAQAAIFSRQTGIPVVSDADDVTFQNGPVDIAVPFRRRTPGGPTAPTAMPDPEDPLRTD